MTATLEADGLAHWYGQVLGVNGLTATVGGGITGLLGPNGAGKSTFMKLITGQLRPSRGTLRVLGLEPFANRALYADLGYAPEHEALYDDMTAREFVGLMMRFHGFSSGRARDLADVAIERVGLGSAADRRIGGYSKGMRQRAKLAQAIAHSPRLLIVDEPLLGLDPLARVHFLELFRELARGGANILISSHILHEIEALTERILLIHRGRILAHGAVPEIRELLGRHPRRVTIRARSPRDLGGPIWEVPGVVSVRVDGSDEIFIETRDLVALQRALPSIVRSVKPGVFGFETTDSGLEAVFDYLVG